MKKTVGFFMGSLVVVAVINKFPLHPSNICAMQFPLIQSIGNLLDQVLKI